VYKINKSAELALLFRIGCRSFPWDNGIFVPAYITATNGEVSSLDSGWAVVGVPSKRLWSNDCHYV